MAMTKGYAARRIQRAFRRQRVKGVIARFRRKGAVIRRRIGLGTPEPTFVETYAAPVLPVGNAGGVFAARISDIPQVAQYFTLYKQYRINWIKAILVPDYNYDIAEPNQGAANVLAVPPFGAQGMARIAFAVNDSPQLGVPPNEAAVLADNGCKIQTIRNKWSVSFKPVPDVAQIGTAVAPVWSRQKYRQWFNFADLALPGNNPLHYGVSYYITQPVNAPANPARFNLYYKVSFSLRDPQ